MEESKRVIGVEVGLLTPILSEIPNIKKVVKLPEASNNTTMYKVLDKDNKVTYIIKQHQDSKLQGGLEWKEQALKEKRISDLLCRYSPYVGKVIDVRAEEDPVYVATEILLKYEGEDLMQYRKQVKVDKDMLCEVLYQSSLAIATAHQQGIFHGDIKPKNMLYNGNTLKLINFNTSIKWDSESLINKYRSKVTTELLGAKKSLLSS
eukprot:TRINITY_DN3097_c0_g1_i3.p1 TRINITY_DN3097_c0_g1~~TRINITY_DN3097_c0_g1_i3.p1  ORF type:complete len:206 (+),score=25.75 TRINITY_DN3097_c0_g1_i3:145-762(+)